MQSLYNSHGPLLFSAKCCFEAQLALQERRFWNGPKFPKEVMFSLGVLQTQINPEIKHAAFCIISKYLLGSFTLSS